ncbi:phage tail tape measure protein [Clostridium brassicae]|uniref:Phage tail tape measure protein n=1 Tax=Clostridium brassicae TaxID=2999072 RepID=A0ABT4D6P5_9CLOT|nr:phage tail tape measure protein [Clostridium brassicae]MCY6957962.1 phage tail tape measure protein [Clostridium brassicae]
MASKTIGVVLSLQDKLSGGLVKVNKNVQNTSKEVKRANQQVAAFTNKSIKNFEKFGDKIVKLGITAGALAGAFIFKVGLDGVKELDGGARKVKSIAKNALELNNIQKDLLKTSNKTGISVQELSETQYSAISSGVKAAESIQASIDSAKLAKAGFTDSNSALKILMSTMNVYGLTGQKAMQSISDKLLVTQNLGVTTVAELAESMGSLTPVAKSAGASINELMAGMASLTKNGLKTDEAVTALKAVFTSVIKPGDEARKTAKKLGIDFSVSAIKSKGFAKFLQEVKDKTKGNTETMGKLFGNVRALSGALVLTGKGNIDFVKSLDAMKHSTGATDEAFKIMEQSLGNRISKLKERFKNATTSIMLTSGGTLGKVVDRISNKMEQLQADGSLEKIADKVGKTINKIINIVAKLGKIFTENKGKILDFIIVFASFYTAIKILNLLKLSIKGVRNMIILTDGTLKLSAGGKFILIAGVIIASLILLYKHSAKFREIIAQVGAFIQNNILPILQQIGQYFTTNILPVLQQMVNYFTTNILPVLIELGQFFITYILPVLIQFASLVGNVVITVLSSLWTILTQIWQSVLVPLFNFFTTYILPVLMVIGQTILALIASVLAPVAQFLMGVFSVAFSTVFPFIVDLISNSIAVIGGIIEALTKIFGGIVNFIAGVFTANWSRAWEGIKSIFSGIWKGLETIAKGVLNGIISAINLVIRGINKVSSVGGLFKGANIPEIPKFAKGTQYFTGGLAQINERGGEIVSLPNGSKVMTHQASKSLLKETNATGSGIAVNIVIQGNIIGNEEYADNLGNIIVRKIKNTMDLGTI